MLIVVAPIHNKITIKMNFKSIFPVEMEKTLAKSQAKGKEIKP
ncbi:hypothetical protein LAYK6_15720 [Lactobacillus amylovorus subsp. amylovorus]|nr:hypothetical protein LAYK6_15720 [Lactobacillus amylovorus]